MRKFVLIVISGLIYGAAVLTPAVAQINAASQRFFAVDSTNLALMDDQRDGIADIRQQLIDRGVIEEAMPTIEVLQVILNLGLIPRENVDFQQAFGIAIGDIIVDEQNFFWVMNESDMGTMPVVMHAERTAFISPVSAMTKRFFQGNTRFDVREFIDVAVESALTAAGSPDAQNLAVDPTE